MNEQTSTLEFTDEDKRETVFHNFDETPDIEGILTGIEEGTYGQQFVIENSGKKSTVGTFDVLKGKIKLSDVGKAIKISYKGSVTSPKTKRVYKDFDVWVK